MKTNKLCNIVLLFTKIKIDCLYYSKRLQLNKFKCSYEVFNVSVSIMENRRKAAEENSIYFKYNTANISKEFQASKTFKDSCLLCLLCLFLCHYFV